MQIAARHPEFPECVQPDQHGSRIGTATGHAAGDRDLPAEEPLGCPRVVGEHIRDVVGLPARIADRMTRVEDL